METGSNGSNRLPKTPDPRNNLLRLLTRTNQQFPRQAPKSNRLNFVNFCIIWFIFFLLDIGVIVDGDNIDKFHGTDFFFGFMVVGIGEGMEVMEAGYVEVWGWGCESGSGSGMGGENVAVDLRLIGEDPELFMR